MPLKKNSFKVNETVNSLNFFMQSLKKVRDNSDIYSISSKKIFEVEFGDGSDWMLSKCFDTC